MRTGSNSSECDRRGERERENEKKNLQASAGVIASRQHCDFSAESSDSISSESLRDFFFGDEARLTIPDWNPDMFQSFFFLLYDSLRLDIISSCLRAYKCAG
jgi:hypothetical protein